MKKMQFFLFLFNVAFFRFRDLERIQSRLHHQGISTLSSRDGCDCSQVRPFYIIILRLILLFEKSALFAIRRSIFKVYK